MKVAADAPRSRTEDVRDLVNLLLNDKKDEKRPSTPGPTDLVGDSDGGGSDKEPRRLPLSLESNGTETSGSPTISLPQRLVCISIITRVITNLPSRCLTISPFYFLFFH